MISSLRPVSSRLYGINTASHCGKAVCEIIFGIDVAKHELVVYRWMAEYLTLNTTPPPSAPGSRA
jgi:hypothetical protein